jgi:hypothetical protein
MGAAMRNDVHAEWTRHLRGILAEARLREAQRRPIRLVEESGLRAAQHA